MSLYYAKIKIKCPKCSLIFFDDVGLLEGSGGVPQTKLRCEYCDAMLCIEAYLDLSVVVE
jgi:hypothetical protein